MADVKNVVTLGIGAAPGGLVWFFTGGLESGAAAAVPGPGTRHRRRAAGRGTLAAAARGRERAKARDTYDAEG